MVFSWNEYYLQFIDKELRSTDYLLAPSHTAWKAQGQTQTGFDWEFKSCIAVSLGR